MATKAAPQKVECLNPNTGGKMNIDKDIYDLFSKAIYHTLKKGEALTYTQMVEGVQDCFKEQKVKFDGSVSWYAVTIKNGMESKGVIETFTEKGKKMHRLKIRDDLSGHP
jgi:hypothetical protein